MLCSDSRYWRSTLCIRLFATAYFPVSSVVRARLKPRCYFALKLKSAVTGFPAATVTVFVCVP